MLQLEDPLDFDDIAPYLHCVPPVEAQSYTFTVEGKTVLALDVAYSTQAHETTGKAVYLRVGRKNQRLGVNDVLRLTYAKGQAALEARPVEEADEKEKN